MAQAGAVGKAEGFFEQCRYRLGVDQEHGARLGDYRFDPDSARARPGVSEAGQVLPGIGASGVGPTDARRCVELHQRAHGSEASEMGGGGVSERPILFSGEMVRAILEWRKTQTRRVCAAPGSLCSCSYGSPGDRLWVRETFSIDDDVVFYRATDHPDCGQPWKPSIHMPREASRISLLIIDVRCESLQDISEEDCKAEGVIIPASRESRSVLLRVSGKHAPGDYLRGSSARDWYRAHFASLWDRLNAKRGFSWSSNPRVWVIKFRRIE